MGGKTERTWTAARGGEASPSFHRVLELADSVAAQSDPARLRWMWGDALFLWSLTELDAFLGEDRFLGLTTAYCDRFAARPPRVDQSDTCAPGLVTWAIHRRTGDPACLALTERVIGYLKDEPRLVGDAPNHLGHSPEGRLYPRSVWVDSLMMFGVLAALYARDSGDPGLLEIAARQPRLYAGLLQDGTTGLFRHSWWARSASPWPRSALFWGRGNGWIVAALPMILGCLPQGHSETEAIKAILRRLSEALLPLQRADGWWDTLLGSRGPNYREASATALVAAGFLRASREGWLDARFHRAGQKAYEALVASLGHDGAPPSLREVSAPTIPLPLFPGLGYRLVPRRADLSYGLAALFLAAIEAEKSLAR
jgi:unsaturated rhamnogalacturonyl hydrolase